MGIKSVDVKLNFSQPDESNGQDFSASFAAVLCSLSGLRFEEIKSVTAEIAEESSAEDAELKVW